jgi:CheY-like chemotaxis protein/GAF domain-containing protein
MDPNADSAPRVLVIRDPADPSTPTAERLGIAAQVRTVESVADALELLRQEHYDWVVTAPEGLSSLERALASDRAADLLEAIGQGVGVLDSKGTLLWANRELLALPDEVRERLAQYAQETHQSLSRSSGPQRSRKYAISTEDSQHFDVTITAVTEGEQTKWLTALIWDNTTSRRLQRRIDAIDQAGRELVRLDAEHMASLDVQERFTFVEERILKYTHELMHFDRFSVHLLDPKTKKLELIAWHGMDPKAMSVDLYASVDGNGISGYVAATGRSYICSDVERDTRYLPGMVNAQSSLTVPLRLHDQVIGVFNIESDRQAAFSEDDRQIAEIFGGYVAMALHILDLLIVERFTTTGRLAENVTSQIAAPLNDILTEASTLIEEYIGNDEMRNRLQGITENVTRIRQILRQVAEGEPVKGVPHMPESSVDPVLAGRRILVADDEEAIRETLRDVLTRQGCEVETARDGDEAAALIGVRDYHLVLSDIRMPGRSGYQIFAATKDHHHDCPVILMTGFGYDPNHSIVRARKEGLAAVLFKPFKVDQLLSDIRQALGNRVLTQSGE